MAKCGQALQFCALLVEATLLHRLAACRAQVHVCTRDAAVQRAAQDDLSTSVAKPTCHESKPGRALGRLQRDGTILPGPQMTTVVVGKATGGYCSFRVQQVSEMFLGRRVVSNGGGGGW